MVIVVVGMDNKIDSGVVERPRASEEESGFLVGSGTDTGFTGHFRGGIRIPGRNWYRHRIHGSLPRRNPDSWSEVVQTIHESLPRRNPDS